MMTMTTLKQRTPGPDECQGCKFGSATSCGLLPIYGNHLGIRWQGCVEAENDKDLRELEREGYFPA